ncbi:UDP-N-acetylglucosamine 2-epimerase (hydrolyzing) [Pseudoalteromonas sp. 13-15]|uniref:UDP-N-acetylglucosamine 2-epimerase n=1 Tax=Pseudoalteromonas TaxID=53246 RepID=UPI0007319195|nr:MULTISPECIES: UDP-N-acetylglucosamine 2-epimerase [Pseudoalteromonas]AUL72141.1 UDP-N-acetylglucosamine 2-epimerase (hydrolyzing) [Pseudoalteromonas sp. 13-15]WFO19785.1 UDP-N-acetylglucosamine 2-epimerase [Pseudoalteromonas sp. H100]SIN72624.1 UDP-N-acetylglucosamine 2-epimerase (non-hydrolysing)/GDP/UDP-N,N'-diacetylbacillosamine 2-epimerase (hydrolysing) [Pseudoalteromonas marina]
MASVKKTKIGLVTTSRSEFGLLSMLIKTLANHTMFNFELYVTGNHLCVEQGLTINEIIENNIAITATVEIMHRGDSGFAKAKTSANAMSKFCDLFIDKRPDLLIIMGDRYELLGIASAAALMSVPIAHFSGGEITQGVIDDTIRHAITKMSQLHFVSNIEHYDRVLQLGEMQETIFTVGEPGLDNIFNQPFMSIAEFQSSISFTLDKPFCILTFHPVPLDQGLKPEKQIKQVLIALQSLVKSHSIIITAPNSDEGADEILPLLTKFAEQYKDSVVFFKSLGFKRYLSALKLCDFVIGNSSSGLIEAPSFNKPAVNIGSRQQGRLRGANVIDTTIESSNIEKAIGKAQSSVFRHYIKGFENPYGSGNTVKQVVEVLENLTWPIECRKKFVDIG